MHAFFSLPFVAKLIGLITAAALVIVGFVKRKAIGSVIGAAWKAVTNKADKWLWRYVSRKVKAAEPPSENAPRGVHQYEKIYRGKFVGYFQHTLYPKENFFELEESGGRTKVPVMMTNMLSGIQPATMVRIDTLVGATLRAEIVLRVREIGKALF